MRYRRWIPAGVVCAILALAPPVEATVLNPGDTNKAVDQLTTFSPTLVQSRNVALTPSDISGQFMASVFRESNGFLDFAYRVQLNSSATGTVNRLMASNFTGFTTDVFFFNVPLETNVPPSSASRSLSGPGANVLFNFSSPVSDGNSNSSFLIVRTNATSFTSTGAVSIDYDQFGNVFGIDGLFAPVALAPEPGALTLALIGLSPVGLVGGYRFWRRRKDA